MKGQFINYIKSIKIEYKIAFYYFLSGIIWILFSDKVLNSVISNVELLIHFQTYKGVFYITVTTFLLYLLIKHHIQKLKDQQLLFETMFNTITDSVVITNTKREIIMANNAAKKTFAFEGKLNNISTQKFYADENDYQRAGKLVFDVGSENVKTSYVINYKDNNNRVFPGESFSAKLLDTKGNWIGNLSIVRDITDRIKSEIEIHESKTKLEVALESMTDAVFISDIEGRLINFNEAFVTFHKFENKECCPKNHKEYPELFEVYLPNGEIAKLDQRPVSRALNGEKAISDEYTIKRKDTGEIWVGSYSFAPIRDKNNTIVGSVVAARDITENKIAQDELIKAKEKAEESDRLKSVFLQNISHEIRTPMNAIIGFSELLCDPKTSPKNMRRYNEIITNSSGQLLSVVNDLLTISILELKQIQVTLSNVNVNYVIKELQSIFLKKALEKDIQFKIENNLIEDFYIYSDEIKIRQVLINLLSNAFKFTKSGSVELGYSVKNNFIEFYVKDTGIGISPKLHERIFEHFLQSDVTINENYGGTGLGLAISKEFIKLIGGNIWLDSDEGKGATFYFTIPFEDSIIEKEVKTTNTSAVKIEKPIILIVEDDSFNFLFIDKLFSDLNITLLHAWNGKEAIEIHQQNPGISMVLMDLKMPIMNGYETTKKLKEKNPQLPIIAISAYALPQEVEKAKEFGFESYLTKPIRKDSLIQLLDKYYKN
ncbi:MAG: ATP-binding protein [Flavobacterium sp.]|uniref:hybrid sensor histidine kinase/response regulator n=1 Tax=Flavobacterium sp. TaxID=239 RepID=UPI0022BD85A5|nr:PAS domain-containing hybrid sensor histidine kinase/response regulator [Flavobacterium sp.]MCZ8198452.1 ATP-binding protein [Flavobacterium sp.]